jgi:hypothetical protein
VNAVVVFVLWVAVAGSWVPGGTFVTPAECNAVGGYVGYCQPMYVGPSTIVTTNEQTTINQTVKGNKP